MGKNYKKIDVKIIYFNLKENIITTSTEVKGDDNGVSWWTVSPWEN